MSAARAEPVAIRRKADGRYLVSANGTRGSFATRPRPVRSEAAAIMLIRVDLGDDLDSYEIIPCDQLRMSR